jgi:Spy/CpxP family protein refolding chaperone
MIQHKKLLFILLIISVSFNVFFILGYARSRHVVKTLKTPEGRAEFVSKKLKLNQEQKAAFFQLGEKIGMEKLKMKEQHSKEIEIFWQELLKNNPDPQKISVGLELRSALDRELQPLQQDFLIKFLKILTPEQRKLFVNLLRKNKYKSYK